VTNADGSNTTTVTYANGTRIEITIPAAAVQNTAPAATASTGAPAPNSAG
jgi:hypothetical protein